MEDGTPNNASQGTRWPSEMKERTSRHRQTSGQLSSLQLPAWKGGGTHAGDTVHKCANKGVEAPLHPLSAPTLKQQQEK